MRRQYDRPAPGWVPAKTSRGWVLLREVIDNGGALVTLELSVMADDTAQSSVACLWLGRDGRRRAVVESWQRAREEENLRLRAENERLRHALNRSSGNVPANMMATAG